MKKFQVVEGKREELRTEALYALFDYLRSGDQAASNRFDAIDKRLARRAELNVVEISQSPTGRSFPPRLP